MERMRRSAAFKDREGMDVGPGINTTAQVAREHGVHAAPVRQGKAVFEDRLAEPLESEVQDPVSVADALLDLWDSTFAVGGGCCSTQSWRSIPPRPADIEILGGGAVDPKGGEGGQQLVDLLFGHAVAQAEAVAEDPFQGLHQVLFIAGQLGDGRSKDLPARSLGHGPLQPLEEIDDLTVAGHEPEALQEAFAVWIDLEAGSGERGLDRAEAGDPGDPGIDRADRAVAARIIPEPFLNELGWETLIRQLGNDLFLGKVGGGRDGVGDAEHHEEVGDGGPGVGAFGCHGVGQEEVLTDGSWVPLPWGNPGRDDRAPVWVGSGLAGHRRRWGWACGVDGRGGSGPQTQDDQCEDGAKSDEQSHSELHISNTPGIGSFGWLLSPRQIQQWSGKGWRHLEAAAR